MSREKHKKEVMTTIHAIPTFFTFKYPILFAEDDTSTNMVKKGVYGHVDDTFKDTRNSIQPPSRQRFNLEAYNFAESITTQGVLDRLESMGKLPACPEHHLAVGYQYPGVLSEIQRYISMLYSQMSGTPLSPEQAQRFELIEKLTEEEEFAMVSIGKKVQTRVDELNVFPGFTNYAFSKKLNLIGYQAKMDRLWDPHYFFLAIAD